jgi:hypothetical protein
MPMCLLPFYAAQFPPLPLSAHGFTFNTMPDHRDASAPRATDPTDLTASPDGDFSAALNARLDGWNLAMGLRLVRATADEVTAEVEIGPRHRQAYGIVHGGVYSGIVETVCSTGRVAQASSWFFCPSRIRGCPILAEKLALALSASSQGWDLNAPSPTF